MGNIGIDLSRANSLIFSIRGMLSTVCFLPSLLVVLRRRVAVTGGSVSTAPDFVPFFLGFSAYHNTAASCAPSARSQSPPCDEPSLQKVHRSNPNASKRYSSTESNPTTSRSCGHELSFAVSGYAGRVLPGVYVHLWGQHRESKGALSPCTWQPPPESVCLRRRGRRALLCRLCAATIRSVSCLKLCMSIFSRSTNRRSNRPTPRRPRYVRQYVGSRIGFDRALRAARRPSPHYLNTQSGTRAMNPRSSVV